jgi:hypothetical protein
MAASPTIAERIAEELDLGGALSVLRSTFGTYTMLAHWQQGEFHHDVVLQVPETTETASIFVVATNCNGGIKEVLRFATLPERYALWHARCPDNRDFCGDLPPILERAVTTHWFDPCELLVQDARSELRVECRERQHGGGWVCRNESGQ